MVESTTVYMYTCTGVQNHKHGTASTSTVVLDASSSSPIISHFKHMQQHIGAQKRARPKHYTDLDTMNSSSKLYSFLIKLKNNLQSFGSRCFSHYISAMLVSKYWQIDDKNKVNFSPILLKSFNIK